MNDAWNFVRDGQRLLRELRSGHYDFARHKRELLKIIASGVTMVQLGTSQQEIEGFQRVYALRRAKNAVQRMRDGLGSDSKHNQKDVEYGLAAGISLSEIGTTQEELDQLPRVFALRRGQKAIASLRDGVGELPRLQGAVKRALDLGISLEELGTNREELDGLPRQHTLRCAQKAAKAMQSRFHYGHDPEKAKKAFAAAEAMNIRPTEYGLNQRTV